MTDPASISGLVLCQQTAGGADGIDDLKRASAAGFRYVSLHTSRMLAAGTGGWLEVLAEERLTTFGYMSIRNILGGAADAEDIIAEAATLGARHIVVTAGPLGEWRPAQADARCAEWFATYQPKATAVGIRLALEPLHPLLSDRSYVHDLAHAHRLVRATPGAGVTVDSGHLWSDEHLLATAETAMDAIAVVQLADIDERAVRAGRYERCGFGQGPVPNLAFIRALRGLGYTGPYEQETRTGNLEPTRVWLEEAIYR